MVSCDTPSTVQSPPESKIYLQSGWLIYRLEAPRLKQCAMESFISKYPLFNNYEMLLNDSIEFQPKDI